MPITTSEYTTGDVLYRVSDGIATITLNRPAQRNALSIAAATRLHSLWGEVDADPSVRVLVLDAAECGTFCAGMDLKEAAEIRRTRGVDILDVLPDPFYERMRAVRKPIIAAMTGHFAAGGMVLGLNADLRVGLAGTRGGITEAKVGRGSPWGVPLLWMLPQPILMELTLTAEMMSIERLHQLGFVNYVEPTVVAVRDRALALAARIRDNAPLSVMAGKESILRAMTLGCEGGLASAKQLYKRVYASDDAQEGPRAFAEKRAPRWTGQ
ncbi:MAG: enoyl-CoA hydratase/isomerase family protein [Burkholderiaceae bacterium]|nr:enoyl-CoA hydratase/isomerase family protein [Burkholderiaceae bacterium]